MPPDHGHPTICELNVLSALAMLVRSAIWGIKVQYIPDNLHRKYANNLWELTEHPNCHHHCPHHCLCAAVPLTALITETSYLANICTQALSTVKPG